MTSSGRNFVKKIIIGHISSRKSQFLFVLGRMLVTINLIILTPLSVRPTGELRAKLHVEMYAHFYFKRQITINDHDLVTL